MEENLKKEILEELESLRQRNAELEITSKQCSWAESRLQKEKERLQRYLDLAGEIVIALDQKGKIILINKRGSQILGYNQNEIIGKNWIENFIPKKMRSQVKNTLAQVLSRKIEGTEYYENPILTSDKSERLIRWHNAYLQDERGIIITLSTGEDITERKLTEWRLKEINKCFLSFGQDATLNINNIVKVCGKLLGADCALYNRIETHKMLRTVGGWKIPPNYEPIDKAQGHICYDVIKEGSEEVLVFRNLDKMPYHKTDPNVAKYGLKTYVGLAVKLGPLAVGSLCAVYKKDFVPTEEDKNLMKIIASAISIEEERQRAEEARIQSLEFYRALIKTSPDAIFLHDSKGKIIMANERAASLFELKHKDEFIGKNFLDLLTSKEKIKAREDLRRIKDKGYSLGQEYNMLKIDGQSFKADINTSVIKDIKGKPEAFIRVVRDVTERKKIENMLRESEQEFRLTFEYARDAIFWADSKTGILLRCNKAAEKLLERNREEIIGKQQTILHPPEKRNYYIKYFKRHVAAGKIIDEEAEIITKSGKIKPVKITANVTPIDDKRIIYGIFRDISDWKKVERDLLFSKSVFDNTKDAVFCMKANGDIFYVNPAASKLVGYAQKELLSMSICDIDISYPRKVWRSTWKDMQRRKIASLESRYRSKDGKIVPVEISANWTESMGQAFTIAIVRDVTERERIEEVLRRSEQEKAVILSSVSEVVIYHDKEMRIVWANKAAEDTIGLYLDKIIGQHCHIIWEKRQISTKTCPVKKAFTSGQPEIKELRSSDGKVWFIRGYPVKNRKGKVIGVVEVSSDITANRTMEQERQKSLEKFRRILEETVIALAATAERRDPYTAGHQRRVAQLACAIAEELGLSEDDREGVRMAAIIHDVGKVYVPSEILSKPSLLTELEFNIIKTHPQIGYEILKPVEFPWPVAEIVLQHHEKINGSGYPSGFTAKDILPEAKILVVADVVEAMASHRPYRAALGIGAALKEIAQNKGILYDSKVVDACFRVFRQRKFKFK